MLIMRGLLLLTISFAIGLIGCGDSTGGYGLFRSRDMITVFVPLADTSKIAEVQVDNKALYIDIDTGEKIVPRVIQLQRRLFQAVEPDETVEIHGRDRINNYAVIHLRTFDTKHKVSKSIELYAHAFYEGFKITNARNQPEPFDNSGAFRFGDKIMAYCRLQDNMEPQPKGVEVNIGGVRIRHIRGTHNLTREYNEIVTDAKSGHLTLIIEKHETKDGIVRNLRFLLKDLEPDETVKVKKIRNLGSRIAIAELAVEPPWEPTLEPQFPEPPQPPERIDDR